MDVAPLGRTSGWVCRAGANGLVSPGLAWRVSQPALVDSHLFKVLGLDLGPLVQAPKKELPSTAIHTTHSSDVGTLPSLTALPLPH